MYAKKKKNPLPFPIAKHVVIVPWDISSSFYSVYIIAAIDAKNRMLGRAVQHDYVATKFTRMTNGFMEMNRADKNPVSCGVKYYNTIR